MQNFCWPFFRNKIPNRLKWNILTQNLPLKIASLGLRIHSMYVLKFYILFCGIMEQWPSCQGTGFPIQGSHVQNHWVAPRLTQPFILLRSIKWVPGIFGNLVVKSKLPPWTGSSLEVVEPHPWKGAIKFFFFSVDAKS